MQPHALRASAARATFAGSYGGQLFLVPVIVAMLIFLAASTPAGLIPAQVFRYWFLPKQSLNYIHTYILPRDASKHADVLQTFRI